MNDNATPFGVQMLAEAAHFGGVIEAELDAARKLIPSEVIDDLELNEDLEHLQALGYRHLQFDLLQDVGRILEQEGQDALLPTEYWRHLAEAALHLQFPRSMQYIVGKMRGYKGRTWNDNLASLICFQRALSQNASMRERHTELAGQLDELVAFLVGKGHLDSKRLAADSSKALASYLDEKRVLYGDASDPVFVGVNQRFQALVDAALDLCVDNDVLVNEELTDWAWSIQCVNSFRIIPHPSSILPITIEEIAWRCP